MANQESKQQSNTKPSRSSARSSGREMFEAVRTVPPSRDLAALRAAVQADPSPENWRRLHQYWSAVATLRSLQMAEAETRARVALGEMVNAMTEGGEYD